MSKPVSPDKLKPKCALCNKRPIVAAYRPFCSRRCADIDLGKWLVDGYAIPGEPADQAEETALGKIPDEG